MQGACIGEIRAGLQNHHWGRFRVRLSGTHWLLRIVEQFMEWRSQATGIATGDQALFVTRAALEQVGGVPDQLLMEDIELSSRLRRRYGYPVRAGTPRSGTAITTDSRRWEQRGIIRCVLEMWWYRLAYRLGVSPQTLHRWYYSDVMVS